MTNRTIRDLVDVRDRPRVVRLDHLDDENSGWITTSYCATAEVAAHLDALGHALRRPAGTGIFLVGPYGSGKSHLVSYVAQNLRAGRFVDDAPEVFTASLLNFRGDVSLEDVVNRTLALPSVGDDDRRSAWTKFQDEHPRGVFLILDELSEFLRSKPDARSFSEDVRFLQYVGEWCQAKRFFLLCSMQEQIEHTGDLEHGLYRKIRDRFPLRLFLTAAHVHDLVRDGILEKKEGYAEETRRIVAEVKRALPGCDADADRLCDIYPLHPSTLELLEEVRDTFSQARGAIDFVLTQLVGDPARGVEPFLDRPVGEMLGPDRIVPHFRDLLELQPEHLALTQRLFPWYQKHLAELFDRAPVRELASRVLNLLVLVHLSPTRDALTAEQATAWLLYRASRIEPERNVALVERVLERFCDQGRHVVRGAAGYHLDFGDSDTETFERKLRRETEACSAMGETVFEEIVPLLAGRPFDPFSLPRDRLQHRTLRWRFHDRRYAVFLGHGLVPTSDVPVVVVRPCFGDVHGCEGAHVVRPKRLAPEAGHFELLALVRLRDGRWSETTRKRVEARLAEKTLAFENEVRTAYAEADLLDPAGHVLPVVPRAAASFDQWLDQLALAVFQRLYPGFERYAPAHGALPKETLARFGAFALSNHLADPSNDDAVQLVREAYLMPMGLLVRQGRGYAVPAQLERRELVRLVLPLLEQRPPPKAVYEHLAQPIYGLVPDQVHALLLALLSLGELDLVKDDKSFRELHELLPSPLQYHRVVPGRSLSSESLRDLLHLSESFGLKPLGESHGIAQRREVQRLREAARQLEASLQPSIFRLDEDTRGSALRERLRELLLPWRTFERGGDELEAFDRLRNEIGPIGDYVARVKAARDLPTRLDRLLRESRRLEHLFRTAPRSDEATGGDAPPIALDDPGDPPPLDDLAGLEAWIQTASAAWAAYRDRYTTRHDAFWRALDEHPAWSYRPPRIAKSRHLQLDPEVARLAEAHARTQRFRCRGRPDLTFQSTCACGFDGRGAPIEDALRKLAQAKERIESSLVMFFDREVVRDRVQQLVREGLETDERTLAYLAGKAPVPEIHDVDRFDRHLSGVELVKRLALGDLVARIEGRTWKRDDLMQAVRAFLDECSGSAERVRLEGRSGGESAHESVAAWCLTQCLRHGVALPAGLPSDALAAAGDAVRPDLVGPSALARLDRLRLPDGLVDRVVGWAIEGVLELPPAADAESALLTAARELLRPTSAAAPRELARLAAALYGVDGRLRRLAGERWSSRLEALANTEIEEPLPSLADRLKEYADEPWLCIDAFGLPFLPFLGGELEDALGGRRVDSVEFAIAPPDTTTDACYRHLADAGLTRGIVKIDVIDALLHEREDPFDDLARVAAAELRGAYRRVADRLDAARPLVVFADHGFRLAENGRGYRHGGPSALERVVPVIRLVPAE